ncbi:TlpA family protein disulfide reductase [Thiobacillus sedimenti]|uniref:TlpA disulfide reductase family protein n=1 Tax=Thiobacillus sedimenti TaxID=3110231 RepID=A0ABZ1CHP9_9PROT|nr:TlpA disulfide reductase family protein [Thiobacillus sp. SCUT-2]WRS38889.1 TlpA disulfide reductase family protein [Thiobacillus sp. SCUT-2]
MDRRAFVKKWTPSPLTLILLGLIAWLWFRPPADVSDEDRAAAPWQAVATDGRTVGSASLEGRVVLVNFWATWCPYCRKEMPAIDRFWRDYRDKGFEVVAISVDDPPEKIAAWMKDKGYTFTAAPTNASVAAAFGDIRTVPTSFIVDADGRIRHKISGQVYYGRLEELIAPLLPRSRTP